MKSPQSQEEDQDGPEVDQAGPEGPLPQVRRLMEVEDRPSSSIFLMELVRKYRPLIRRSGSRSRRGLIDTMNFPP